MKNSKIKADIVNEGSQDVERLAAKIVMLPGGTSTFIKTYASFADRHNVSILKKIESELTPSSNNGFLGIGIISYADINYIEFYSAFRSFTLNPGDEITLYFDDEREINFEFNSVNRAHGYMRRNSCFIPDNILSYLTTHKLEGWKLTNKADLLSLIGSFNNNDFNDQYSSKKAGQKMLQDMATEILSLKPLLRAG